jgi:2-dehydropantoate 2-reductase
LSESRPLKIAIVGLGAIGGWVAGRFAAAGHHVSAFARGATLSTLRERGLTLEEAGDKSTFTIAASDDAEALGTHDLVLVAVKAQSLPHAATAVARLMRPETLVVPLMNGVPWWFFADVAADTRFRHLDAVDPNGRIARAIPTENVIGAVVHASCETRAPAHIAHRNGNGIILGEIRGGQSERVAQLASLFRSARFEVTVSERIQTNVWYKLWGNMTMNPISAVTGVTCDRILDDPLLLEFVLRVMAEAAEIGARIGCPIAESGRDRVAVTRKLGVFKTSMLQDVEAGRSLEIDALLAAPREIAAKLGITTPNMDALLGLVRVFARRHGLV